MAVSTQALISFKHCPQPLMHSSFMTKNYGLKPSISFWKTSSPMIHSAPLRLRISCAAKPETVQKVSDIVKQQLALSKDTTITGETKFSELGADSLDTVEIVMKIEEEFGVSVEEESAQSITTIQGVADLIENLQTQ